jgi:glycine dehydrogenase subunit 1
VVKVPKDASIILKKLAERGIQGGVDLSNSDFPNHILVAVTEKRTKEEMDLYVQVMREIISN